MLWRLTVRSLLTLLPLLTLRMLLFLPWLQRPPRTLSLWRRAPLRLLLRQLSLRTGRASLAAAAAKSRLLHPPNQVLKLALVPLQAVMQMEAQAKALGLQNRSARTIC